MGSIKDYANKSPVEGTDKLLGTQANGDTKNYDVDDLKSYIESGTAVPFINVTGSGDDTGLIVTEQLSVGTASAGKETCLGGGDSYPIVENGSSAWHCDIANTTGMVITSATDVSTEMGSDNGSTIALFGGTAAGKYVLVGSDEKYGGVKAKIDTLGTVEADNVLAEYLADVDTWVTSPFMATDADFPYEQKGKNISTCSSCSEHWRFGFNPLIQPVPWEKVEMTINGTGITKYWARFRITSDITLDPILQQIKLHTNRMEINADGVPEFFGRARFPRSIPITIEANADKTPLDEDLKIASGITVERLYNEFADLKVDGAVLSGTVPEGLDTSIPVTLYVDWYAKDNTVGDVELEVELVPVTGSFVFDGAATGTALTPVVTSVDGEQEVRQTSIFQAVVQESLPGDQVFASLFRDATTNNTDDNYGSAIVITGIRLVGYFWKL